MRVDYWKQGYDARVEGKSIFSNPYPEFNDKRFDEWDAGYLDRQDSELDEEK